MTAPYWKDYAANWTMMGYNTPPGCDIVPRESKLTEFCDWDAFHVPEGLTLETNITHCQACLPDSQGDKWSYVYWIFTTAPGMFGMPSGYANITGVVLIFIMTVIFVGSLAVVRRSGYFQVKKQGIFSPTFLNSFPIFLNLTPQQLFTSPLKPIKSEWI